MAEDPVNHFIARKATKPPHERPQTFSAVDQTLFMLQMQLDELRASIDDAKAMAVQAGNMPRQAAGGEEGETLLYPWKVEYVGGFEEQYYTYRFRVHRGRYTLLVPKTGGSEVTETVLTLSTDSGKDYLTFDSYFPWTGYLYAVAFVNPEGMSKDQRLMPNTIDVCGEPDIPFGGKSMPPYWGSRRVLGYFDGTSWTQMWTGGDITESIIVADSEAPTAGHPQRSTIERCPATDQNEGVLQIANADTAQYGTADVNPIKSVPLLSLDTDGDGAMEWHGIDKHADVDVKTLEVTGSPSHLSVHGASVVDEGKNVAYVDYDAEGSDGRVMKFAGIDTHQDSPTGKSIEIASDRMQIRGWGAASETAQAAGDLLLAQREVSGARDVVYLDVDDLSVKYAETAGTVENCPEHSHDHGTLTGLNDDDHSQYLLLSGGATRNAMPGGAYIGDGLEHISVYPAGRSLWSSDGNERLAWESGTLRLSGAMAVLNWFNRQLLGDWIAEDGNFEVKASGKAFKHNGVAGITKTIEWDDANGQKHTLTVSGGIITGHTVA